MNLVVVGHVDSGKTRLLYLPGFGGGQGDGDGGNASFSADYAEGSLKWFDDDGRLPSPINKSLRANVNVTWNSTR